ncbi:hypothetical protein [Calidithermus timidus]|uniref:hypothetical protein n=1 Tax=Calidithermus timidus TaxID=307124 RepID=UPI00039F0546|nr:hypothetical protein [Calidithermus timidus]
MAPVWCDLRTLPYEQMWDDARYWMPRVLEGRKVRMRFAWPGPSTRNGPESRAALEPRR